MAYIIGDNAFTQDSHSLRGTRLSSISGNIDTYAAELEIEASLLAWAQTASAAYNTALVNQTNKQGEKDVAFGDSQKVDEAMYVRYIELRGLVRSRYGSDKLTLKEYGIIGPMPKGRLDKYYKAIELIKKNDEQIAAGDPKALPAAMVASLVLLADDAEAAYKVTGVKSRVAKESTKSLKAIFDADTVKLRILYNWSVSYWGKSDPRLIAFGFVEAYVHHHGQPKASQNLSFDGLASVFSWDAADRATSYQCAMKGAGRKASEWNEIYEGTDTSFFWQKAAGSWNVKVRARNRHGFGHWGEEIEVEAE